MSIFVHDTVVGDYCTVGHRATLHGCTVEEACLIGIGATLMEGVVIGRGSVVAAHSFLPAGKIIPPQSVVMGSPAKIVRTQDATRANIINALLYRENALAYRDGQHRAWAAIDIAPLEAEADAILATPQFSGP